ncbi:MAG: cell division protein FtsA [Bacteroidia bacterium]|nr:MAG: cell division protein FtsA [Bacteroidia bacterium]
MKKIVKAIDIGTTKIVALVGEKSEDGTVKILAKTEMPTPEECLKYGKVRDIDRLTKTIRELLKVMEETSGYVFDKVNLGVAGQVVRSEQNSHTVSVRGEDEIVMDKHIQELEDAVAHFGKSKPGFEVLKLIPLNYQINDEDIYSRPPLGHSAHKLSGNYQIILGDTIAGKDIERSVKSAGVKEVLQVHLQPEASAEAVLTEDEKRNGVAMVDIGGGTTDIAIYHEGMLKCIETIPFGSGYIDKQICNHFSISPARAAEIKEKYGKALAVGGQNETIYVAAAGGRRQQPIDSSVLSLITEKGVAVLSYWIVNALKNSGYANKLIAGITLTGGGSLMKYMKQALEYYSTKKVEIVYPLESLSGPAARVNSPKYSTAVGLVMLGGAEVKKEETKKRRSRKKAVSEKSRGGKIGIMDSLWDLLEKQKNDVQLED